MAPQSLRMRILTCLQSLLLSQEGSIQVNTPGALSTLIQGLFSLLSSLAFLSTNSPESQLVRDLIRNIQSGGCAEMIPEALEREFKVAPSEEDEDNMVMQALVVSGIVWIYLTVGTCLLGIASDCNDCGLLSSGFFCVNELKGAAFVLAFADVIFTLKGVYMVD